MRFSLRSPTLREQKDQLLLDISNNRQLLLRGDIEYPITFKMGNAIFEIFDLDLFEVGVKRLDVTKRKRCGIYNHSKGNKPNLVFKSLDSWYV